MYINTKKKQLSTSNYKFNSCICWCLHKHPHSGLIPSPTVSENILLLAAFEGYRAEKVESDAPDVFHARQAKRQLTCTAAFSRKSVRPVCTFLIILMK